MNKIAIMGILLMSTVSCASVPAKDGGAAKMVADNSAIVKTFYTKCLTVNSDTDVGAVMGTLLADNFQSLGSVDKKEKGKLIGQVQFFWKLIPDLKWEVQEMIVDGNRVVVRSIASGKPKGDFMGTPTDGSKAFKIMTIDIHTVENGKIVRIHHLEDWGTAMKQLKG